MWTCPECNKELKIKGSHTHKYDEVFNIEENDLALDDGAIATQLTISLSECACGVNCNCNNAVEEECVCAPEDINVDCMMHGSLLTCPYCGAAKTYEAYYGGRRPSVQDYRCTMCGRIWTLNIIEKALAWKA